METIITRLKDLQDLARKAGPYLILEILLPGGTLIALLLFLYQRRQAGGRMPATVVAVACAIGRMRDAMLLVPPLRVAAAWNSGRQGEPDGLEPLGITA